MVGMIFSFANEGYRDLKRFKHICKTQHNPEYQKSYWFIRGCLLEKTASGKKLLRYDKTVFELTPILKLLKRLGMKEVIVNGDLVKIKGSGSLKIIAGTALRIPVLGAGLYGFIQSWDVIKAKGVKSKLKETAKGIIKVSCFMATGALFGCVGRFHGKITEMLAMGGGYILGAKLANIINSKIFNENN